MSSDPLLQLLTRAFFLAIFALAALDLLRRRDLARLEIALLFGTLALAILLQVVEDLGWAVPPWLSTLSILAVLAQPYLLVRLLGHFRSVPRIQHNLAVIGLIV